MEILNKIDIILESQTKGHIAFLDAMKKIFRPSEHNTLGKKAKIFKIKGEFKAILPKLISLGQKMGGKYYKTSAFNPQQALDIIRFSNGIVSVYGERGLTVVRTGR